MNLYIWLSRSHRINDDAVFIGGFTVVADNLDDAHRHLRDTLERNYPAIAIDGSWPPTPPDRTYRLDATSHEFDIDPDGVYPPEVLIFPGGHR